MLRINLLITKKYSQALFCSYGRRELYEKIDNNMKKFSEIAESNSIQSEFDQQQQKSYNKSSLAE